MCCILDEIFRSHFPHLIDYCSYQIHNQIDIAQQEAQNYRQA